MVAKAKMGKQGKRKAGLVTEASSRKARRKEQRQMKKQRRARSASFDSADGRRRSESGDSWTQMSKQGGGGGKKSKSSTASNGNKAKANSGFESKEAKKKRSSSVDKQQSSDAGDPYAHLDPAVAAQLRADDAEIAEMERMLGVGGGGAKTAEERKRLNKEFEKLEGYGSDFGEFLYDLDGLAERLGGGEDGSDSDDNIHMNNDDNGEGDDYSEDSAASDVDMREQYESEEDEVVENSAEKKKDKSSKKDKKKKKSKSKEAASSSSSDPYAHMDDETAAALRAEDAEIAALEDKLGIKTGKKDRKKLNKEYASEGYDDSFGDWLYGLDDMVGRLANGKGGDYDDGEFSGSDASSTDYGDESSDGEEMLPMKDPAMSDEEEDFDDEFHARYAAASRGLDEEEQSSSASDSDSDSDGSTNDSGSGSGSESNNESGNSDDSSDEEEGAEADHEAKFTYRPSAGEDIYGNRRDDADDSGLKPTKYVPPHLRKKMAQEQSEEGTPSNTLNKGGKNNDLDEEKKDEDDPDRQENLRSIKRSLNNVLNRLSDQMLESVSKSISGMYRSNPVNDVNECFLTNIKNACVPSNLVMSGLIPIYVACASGVHVQTGDDVQLGGYLLEHIVLDLLNELEEARNVQEDDTAIEYDEAAGDESVLSNKRPCNLVLILCYLYNYTIVHCALMYDLIRELIENFSEMDVEVLLLILSHCGYQLRSDDPTALKDIVLLVQDRAIRAMDEKEKDKSVRSASSSRVQYMIGAMTDLKNNKRRKKEAIGQKTASYRKIVGRIKSTSANSSFGRSSDASMRIKLQDIKDIDTKGRWWKVGAKWRGNQFHDGSGSASGSHDVDSRSKSQSASEKEEDALLVLASKYRMNTDLRRSIFCIIMGSTDCEDAFEKLVRAGMLKGKAERDVIRVLIECCSQEKSYNPYYAHLASRICEYQPSCNFTLRLTYWDAFKQFDSMKPRKAANMAKLLAHLVCNGRGLNLNVLKVIDIDNDGMSEKAIIFLMVLFTTLFEAFDDPLQVTGLFEAAFASSKKKRKRSMGDEDDIPDDDSDGLKESLSLFLLQFLKKSPKNVRKSKFRTNFKAAVKACETDELDMMM